ADARDVGPAASVAALGLAGETRTMPFRVAASALAVACGERGALSAAAWARRGKANAFDADFVARAAVHFLGAGLTADDRTVDPLRGPRRQQRQCDPEQTRGDEPRGVRRRRQAMEIHEPPFLPSLGAPKRRNRDGSYRRDPSTKLSIVYIQWVTSNVMGGSSRT